MSNELQSSEIKDLVSALVKVQSEIRDAEKNSTNPHFKSHYANLESVIGATREPFAKNNLVVTQQGAIVDGKPVLITTLMHISGQWIRSTMPIPNDKNTAQGLGAGISYVRRYALAAIAGITQVDDDGNEASSVGSPGLDASARAARLDQIHSMVKVLGRSESQFADLCSRTFKRKVEKVSELTDQEIQQSIVILNKFIDEDLKKKGHAQ